MLELVPNNILFPVPIIVNCVPITVWETDVPLVIIWLSFDWANDIAASLSIPDAVNCFATLTSEIVNEYPACSVVPSPLLFPK